MCMLFENKEKRYKTLLIFIIPLFVLLLVFGFLTVNSASSLLGDGLFSSKDTYDIEEYDYHLRSNATDLQKDLFKELDELIKDGTDDLAIAESVVKNYVADTYTWDNKGGQWDIGGMCYVYSPMKGQFYYLIKDYFYEFLNKYQDEYGKTGLLEVSEVKIESSSKQDTLYEVDENEYVSYKITCSWDFSENSKLAEIISKKQHFQVIKNNDGRFEIVTCYGDFY